MKKALITILVILATLLVFVSCENSIDDMFNPQTTKDEVWQVGSQKYATLQEAISAPKGAKAVGTIVKLLKTAEGPGAVISSDIFNIDFNGFGFKFTGDYGLKVNGTATVNLTNSNNSVISFKETTEDLVLIDVDGNDAHVNVNGSTNLSVEPEQYVFWAKNGAGLTAGNTDVDTVSINGKLAATNTEQVTIQKRTTVKTAKITLTGNLATNITLNTVKQDDGTGRVEIGTFDRQNTNATVTVGNASTQNTVIVNDDSGESVITGNTDAVATESFTITFVLNGGSWYPAEYAYPTVYKVGTGVASLPGNDNVKYEGGIYVFDKWVDEDGNPVTSITVEETGDKTFYAKWTAETYSVTLHDNGGTISEGKNVTSYTYGVGATLPTSDFITKTNYTFGGWYATSGFDGDPVTAIGKTETGNKSFWAKWNAVAPTVYTVTFNANGGTGSMAGQEFTSGVAQKLSKNTFARDNYEFDGWATSADGPKVYDDEQSVTISQDRVLYARWTPASVPTFTIVYNAGGASGSVPASQIVNVGDSVTISGKGELVNTGYTFNNWKDDSENSYTAGVSYEIAAEANTTVTLYAQWTANTYTVTFDANGGSIDPSDTTVTYGQAYGAIASTSAGTKSGYNFLGWSLEEVGSPITTDTLVSTASNHTLYAQWTNEPAPSAYTVSFDANGGSTADPESKTVTYGSTYGALATTSREGYEFNGWFTAPTEGTEITSATEVTLTANQTLYAHWLYEISYDANKADSGSAPASQTNLVEGSNVTLATNSGNLAKTGYTFNGWNTNPAGGSDTHYDACEVLSTGIATGNTTLYAEWTPITYKVHFNSNGGSGEMADQVFTYDEAPTALSSNTYTKPEGKDVFFGWTTSANGTGNFYEDGQSVSNLAVTQGAEVTLYAQWVKVDNYVGKVMPADDSESPKYITSVFYGKTATGLSESGVRYGFYYSNDNGSSFTELLNVGASAIVSGNGDVTTVEPEDPNATTKVINKNLQAEVVAGNANGNSVIYYAVFIPEGASYLTNNDDYASFYMYISSGSDINVYTNAKGSTFAAKNIGWLIRDKATDVPTGWINSNNISDFSITNSNYKSGRKCYELLVTAKTDSNTSYFAGNGSTKTNPWTVWKLVKTVNSFDTAMYKGEWFVPTVGEVNEIYKSFGSSVPNKFFIETVLNEEAGDDFVIADQRLLTASTRSNSTYTWVFVNGSFVEISRSATGNEKNRNVVLVRTF